MVKIPIGDSFHDEVKAALDRERKFEIPGFPNWNVFKRLAEKHTSVPWGKISKAATEQCSDIIQDELRRLVREFTTQFPKLEAVMLCATDALVQDCVSQLDSDVVSLLETESKPHTENHYLSNTIQKIRMARIMIIMDNCTEIEAAKARVAAFANSGASNEDAAVQETMDWLAAYWKVGGFLHFSLLLARYTILLLRLVCFTDTTPFCLVLLI